MVYESLESKRLRANRPVALMFMFLLAHHLSPASSHVVAKRCPNSAEATSTLKKVMITIEKACSSVFLKLDKCEPCKAATTTTTTTTTAPPDEDIEIDVEIHQEGSVKCFAPAITECSKKTPNPLRTDATTVAATNHPNRTKHELTIVIDIEDDDEPTTTTTTTTTAAPWPNDEDLEIRISIDESAATTTTPAPTQSSGIEIDVTYDGSSSSSHKSTPAPTSSDMDVEIDIDIEGHASASSPPANLHKNIEIMISLTDKLASAHSMLKSADFKFVEVIEFMAAAGAETKLLDARVLAFIGVTEEIKCIESILSEFIQIQAEGCLTSEERAVEAVVVRSSRIVKMCQKCEKIVSIHID